MGINVSWVAGTAGEKKSAVIFGFAATHVAAAIYTHSIDIDSVKCSDIIR
jgi:hypothetical protein